MEASNTAPETLTKKQRRRQLRALHAQQEETQAAIAKLEAPKEKKSKETKTETTPATQAAPNKPGPSGVNVETSRLVRSIGAVILAAGIIGLLIWQFGGAELLQLILYVVLPVLALFAAFKLVSYGTLQLIWNSDLDARVNAYMKGLKGEPVAA